MLRGLLAVSLVLFCRVCRCRTVLELGCMPSRFAVAEIVKARRWRASMRFSVLCTASESDSASHHLAAAVDLSRLAACLAELSSVAFSRYVSSSHVNLLHRKGGASSPPFIAPLGCPDHLLLDSDGPGDTVCLSQFLTSSDIPRYPPGAGAAGLPWLCVAGAGGGLLAPALSGCLPVTR